MTSIEPNNKMRSKLYLCHGLLILVSKQNDRCFYLQQDENLFTYFTITEFSKFFEKVMPDRTFSNEERLDIIPVWIQSQAHRKKVELRTPQKLSKTLHPQ